MTLNNLFARLSKRGKPAVDPMAVNAAFIEAEDGVEAGESGSFFEEPESAAQDSKIVAIPGDIFIDYQGLQLPLIGIRK